MIHQQVHVLSIPLFFLWRTTRCRTAPPGSICRSIHSVASGDATLNYHAGRNLDHHRAKFACFSSTWSLACSPPVTVLY